MLDALAARSQELQEQIALLAKETAAAAERLHKLFELEASLTQWREDEAFRLAYKAVNAGWHLWTEGPCMEGDDGLYAYSGGAWILKNLKTEFEESWSMDGREPRPRELVHFMKMKGQIPRSVRYEDVISHLWRLSALLD